jgi:hypothetical protein
MATSRSFVVRLESTAGDAKVSTVERYAGSLEYVVRYHLVPLVPSTDEPSVVVHESSSVQRASGLRFRRSPRGTMTRLWDRGCASGARPRRVSRHRRCSEASALRWRSQIARATRGRDLHLNVPFPRKPPDLLMAESPPTGGLSAFNRPAVDPLVARRLSSLHTPTGPGRCFSGASRTLPIDARGAVWDASLEDGPRLAEHQSVEPVHHGLDERESGAGGRRIRAGCRSASL